MTKKTYLILLVFLLSDLAFSFYQHYHMPLYGDVAEIVIPDQVKGYYHVLHDPLGLDVLIRNETYANPNRYFAHWSASQYFLHMPLLLQKFVSPIDSIYLSVALAKIIIQLLVLYLLAVFVSGTGNILKPDFLLAAALMTFLFQTSGYNRYMGIIDPSVIYSFFYALPLGLLLLFFLPFFRRIYYSHHNKPGIAAWIALALFIPVLCLNGPLVPGVVLIACPLVLLYLWQKQYRILPGGPLLKNAVSAFLKIPKYVLYNFAGICLASLYSLYIGRNNSLNYGETISLAERYSRIPAGIYYLLTQKPGFLLLFSMIGANLLIIRIKHKTEEARKLLQFINWIFLFALLYILMLPLGGFRSYRSNIIRYDTIMPVTLGMIYIFGASSFFLIKCIPKSHKILYISLLVMVSLLFTNADRPDNKDYVCERQALESMSRSNEKVIALNCSCPVMEWHEIRDYNRSDLNAGLFYYWHVTKEKKLYYQTENQK